MISAVFNTNVKPAFFFFYVLLTAHLGIILFNDQLDTHFFFVYVSFNLLYVLSIQVLITRRFKCTNTTSGMSLYVGDRLVCRSGRNVIQTCIPDSHLHRVTYTRCRIDTFESPDDERLNA